MTTTHFSGPLLVSGPYASPTIVDSQLAPSAVYQGTALIDPRSIYKPGATGQAQVLGFMGSTFIPILDAVPKAPAAALIVAAQTTPVVPVGGTLALPLVTTLASGRAVSVPLIPYGGGSSSLVTAGVMIDPGHTIGTTSAGTGAVTAVGDTGLLPVGGWIGIIGGASGGILPFVTQIIAKTATTLTVSPVVPATVSGGAIIVMDSRGVGATAFLQTGSVSVFDAYGSTARAVSVTTTAADTTFAVLVAGYDVFNVPMSEQITCGSTTTVNGKKAFKFITSATLVKTGGGTMAGNVSVGTSDIIGLNMRGEFWEYLDVYFNGALVASSSGLTAALATGTVSTTTTADVRGTYTPGTTDGTKRLVIFAQPSARQSIGATYADPTRIDGQTQA